MKAVFFQLFQPQVRCVLLPGGAVNTGGIINDIKHDLPFTLLSPEVMADPIVFLASSLADGITGERIIAKEFDDWLKEWGRTTANN